ncbi:MAG: tetratricopeptide repeat protein, partial [Chloroflexota bacterium]
MTGIDIGARLAEGLAAHQAGRLLQAERAYRAVLKRAPNQPDALHLLGVLTLQQGRPDEAGRLVERAIQVAPGQPTFWNSLGAARRVSGRLDDAAAAFARATTLAPTYAEGWVNLAAVHEARGDRPAEAAALERVVALVPGHARAWGRRGVLAYLDGKLASAADYMQQAVTLAPEDAELLSNYGVVLIDLGRHADAVAAYERALALQPANTAALRGLGDALVNLKEYRRAIPLYERALAGSPRDPDAYEHLELAIQELGRPDAVSGEPSSVAADLQRLVAALRGLLATEPDCPQTLSYFIVALDVTDGAEMEAQAARQQWNARFGAAASSLRQPHTPHTNDRTLDRPLRVGYVSADFRHHSAAFLILPILRAHDRRQVQVYCYSGVTAPDPITEQCRALADHWRETAQLSDDELTALIRQDQIDILVDLSGHTRANRLAVFAREPAPVQVTAWGYATGTGLDAMHYFLADPVVVPAEAHGLYTETVVNLPGVVCYEPPAFAPVVAPLPALARGHITFGAFNRLTKITPESVAAWGRVLMAVPDARLIVKSAGLDGDADRERLLRQLAAAGVARERVTLLGATPQGEHMAAHAEIDLMLDTFPHCGGITTLDALLMGVPMVTLLGERVAGRLSASFLRTLGLDDLVAVTV